MAEFYNFVDWQRPLKRQTFCTRSLQHANNSNNLSSAKLQFVERVFDFITYVLFIIYFDWLIDWLFISFVFYLFINYIFIYFLLIDLFIIFFINLFLNLILYLFISFLIYLLNSFLLDLFISLFY